MWRWQRGSVLIWVALGILVAACSALGYWYFYPQQRPQWVREHIPLPTAPWTKTLYKWRDGSGTIQYSNTRPPEGVSYETIEYREDANVVPPGSDPFAQ